MNKHETAQALQLPVRKLHPFEGHPFQVKDDDEMEHLVWSILTQGMLTPIVARPLDNGEYEVISGHRRLHACQKAGIATVPVLIYALDRDAAAIALVDSNLHREKILPSEKAFAYKLKMEAMSRQGQRTDLTSDQVGPKLTAAMIAEDIERLSRGSSVESGHIMQVLQLNNCKIITPGKTYDLQNDSDEQFTDMKFMFSRYELKTITKRLVRGRNQSASEGKFLGSMAPYGYRIYKLPGEKGNSLRIEPEEAKVVRMIYDMYGQQGLGYNTIAYKLNQLHIPALSGTWGQTSVVNILNNEVYLGKIRWRNEPTKRIVKDGMLIKKRVHNPDYELYEGRHEAIITEEQ